MKKIKFEHWIAIIFAAIGVIVITGGIFLHIKNNSFIKKAEKTSATITSIHSATDKEGNTTRRVMVSFTVEGKNYEGKLNEYSSDMEKGDPVNIYYNIDNPSVFLGSSSGYVGYIVIAVGSFFLLGGGLMYLLFGRL